LLEALLEQINHHQALIGICVQWQENLKMSFVGYFSKTFFSF
jgi:hypothetical protein